MEASGNSPNDVRLAQKDSIPAQSHGDPCPWTSSGRKPRQSQRAPGCMRGRAWYCFVTTFKRVIFVHPAKPRLQLEDPSVFLHSSSAPLRRSLPRLCSMYFPGRRRDLHPTDGTADGEYGTLHLTVQCSVSITVLRSLQPGVENKKGRKSRRSS